jgi:predicted ATP-dependent endonuclease of OLD family
LESSVNLIAANAGISSLSTSFGSSVRSAKLEAVTSDATDLARQVDIHIQDSMGPHLPIRLQGAGIRSAAAIVSFDIRMRMEQLAKQLPPAPVLLIEEPEAHLHPIAQRSVAKIIGQFAGQVVVATHSPAIVLELASEGEKPLSQIRSLVCTPAGRTVGRLRETQILAGAATLAFRLIQQNEGTSLFSRAVVLVEGITDLTALPIFADCHFHEKDWLLNHGISVNRMDGVGSLRSVALVLQDLGIPCVVLYDRDKGEHKFAGVQHKYPSVPDLEGELVSDAHRATSIDLAISNHHSSSGLSDFIAKKKGNNPGADYQPEKVRDWKDSDWTAAFLREKYKNEQIAAIAKAICESGSVPQQSKVPAGVRSVLEYVESVTKGA